MPRKPDSSSSIKFIIRKGPSVTPEQDHRPQPAGFEFVHGKDRESRTRVRKHVMRGWRRNKKQQFDSEVEKTRGLWPSNETAPEADTPGASSEDSPPQPFWHSFGDATSSFYDSDADWDLDDWSIPMANPEKYCLPEPDKPNCGQTGRDPALRTIGAGWRTDSHGCIPSKPDDIEPSVVDYTLNGPPETRLGFSPPPNINPSPGPAFAPGPEDPTPSHETLILSSTHDHSAQRGRDCTPEFLHHKLEAIRHMNLALADPRKSTCEEMIQVALYLAGVEVCPLDLIEQESRSTHSGIARVHLSGIRRMIELCNSYTDSKFSRRLEVELLSTECLIPTAPDSILFTPSHRPSSCEELIDFFTDLSCLSPTARKEQPLIPHGTLLHTILLTTPPETELTRCSHHFCQFSQLASLFYLCSATLDCHSSRPQFQQPCSPFPSSSSSKPPSFFAAVESQLLAHLVPSRFTFTTSPHMLLWILLSGLDAPKFDNRDRGWRVARLMHVTKCVAPERRERWRDVMLDFLTGISTAYKEGDSMGGVLDVEEVRGEILGMLRT